MAQSRKPCLLELLRVGNTAVLRIIRLLWLQAFNGFLPDQTSITVYCLIASCWISVVHVGSCILKSFLLRCITASIVIYIYLGFWDLVQIKNVVS
jgi:hypothetical protein